MIGILYVDDEPALLDICTVFLERTGDFAVDTVLSGKEALEQLEKKQYDAIVSDYQMPGMDGISLLKHVRFVNGEIPFILFTGKGREDVVIDAINNGADFYLQKGGDPTSQFAELAHKVRQAISRRQAEEARRLNSMRLEAMLRLYSMQDRTVREITDFALEAGVKVTSSAIGYLAFLSEDESVLTMYSWSTSALEDCTVARKPTNYPVHTTGLWGEAIRQRRPIITNDYAAQNPLKKGIPEGHVRLTRHMNIPVFDGHRIVIVAGVGNKKTDYTEEDVRELSLLMNELWGIIRGKRRDESLRMLAEMLDTAPGSITIHDFTGRFLYANRKTFEIHGYEEREFMDLPLRDVDVPESQSLVEERMREVEERGEASFEVSHYRKDGTRIPLEVLAKKVDWNGAPAILSIATDITERRQRTEALRKSEERNTALLSALPDLIFILNKDGIFVDYNAGNLQDLLVPPESFLQKHITDILPPDLARETGEHLKSLLATGESQYYEYALDVRGELQFYENRMVLCGEDKVLSMVRNISERRRMEKALFESEEKYRIVAEQASDGIAIVQNGRLVYINPGLAAMAGYTVEELTGASFIRFVALESVLDLMEIMKRAFLGEPVPAIYHTRIRHRDGHLIEIEANGTQITWKGSKALLGIIRDVTRQKLAEARLRESEARFRRLVDTLPDIIWELDNQGRFVYASRQSIDILGFTPEELAGRPFLTLISENLQPATAQKFAAQMERRIPFFTLDVEARHKDGHPVLMEIRSAIISGNNGEIAGLRGVARDITDRRRAEEAVKAGEERFQTLADMLPQIIFEMDTAGRIRYANRQAFDMLHVSREDFVNGVAGLDFIAEQDRARAAADIRRAMGEGPGKGSEYRILRGDGTTFPGLIFSVPVIQGRTPAGLRGMIVDISERKQMEEALRETGEKLRILTGITRHDIQNSAMILRAYLAQAQLSDDPAKMKEFLAKADAVAQIVQDITTFAKTYEEVGGKEPVWLDLNRVVTDEAALAGTGSYELVLPAGGYEIFVDRLFGRVFYNLIENTLRYSRTATRITVSVRESGDGMVILYEDNGIGIAAGEKERIFEKGIGKGTGLGLFLIRQILAITGITIRETGEPGKGARFEMAFPPGEVRRREAG